MALIVPVGEYCCGREWEVLVLKLYLLTRPRAVAIKGLMAAKTAIIGLSG